MYLGRVSMLSAFLFDRMFVVFDLFWLSACRVCILLVWILVRIVHILLTSSLKAECPLLVTDAVNFFKYHV